MKILFGLAIGFMVFSCKEGKRDVVDMNDIVAKSEKYNGKESKEAEKIDTLKMSDVFLSDLELKKSELAISKARNTDTLLFPDRFKFTKKTTFLYSLNADSVLYSKWNFRDSTKTKNAFLNWTNCFGTKCNAIRIGQKANLQKDGFLLLVNDTCMIYVGTHLKSEQEKWISYYTSDKKQKWTYMLSQTKNGKVNWQSFKDKKMIPIEENKFVFE